MGSPILDARGFTVDDGVDPDATPCGHCGVALMGVEPVGVIATRCGACRSIVCDLHGEVLVDPDGNCPTCDNGPFRGCSPQCPCCHCRVMANPDGFVDAMEA